MYEFSVARKYLIPRVRQLSVSIISLISVFVIATVVWLSIVFFSVQEGIERSWTEKMVALTSPLRLTPTSAYYNSYYYQIDTHAEASNFATKTLRQKLQAPTADPYNPLQDPSLPNNFPPLVDLDIAKETRGAILSVPNVTCNTFETVSCGLKVRLIRDYGLQNSPSEQVISANTYLMSFNEQSQRLAKTLLPITTQDIQNVLAQTLYEHKSLEPLFQSVRITEFTVGKNGYRLPDSFIEEGAHFSVIGHLKDTKLLYITFSKTENSPFHTEKGTLRKTNGALFFNEIELQGIPIYLDAGTCFNTTDSLHLQTSIQKQRLQGKASFEGLEVKSFHFLPNPSPPWLSQFDSHWHIPTNGIILPKGFKEAGSRLGDQAILSYQGFGTTGMQELRQIVVVAGFYDPGIIPIGGKVVLASQELVQLLESANVSDDRSLPMGFAVDFAQLKEAKAVKQQIIQKLQAKGLASYWNVQTYDEYEFTKEIFQQMKSDKNLFSLISVIITIVACSNIISMLIILVHDKRKEIAVLRALGATKKSIACIFGLCGFLLGAIGSFFGTLIAIATLHNITAILAFISKIQGFEVLSSTFYANSLPDQVSSQALFFVTVVSALGSMIAGIIPAIQASRINTSEALRNE